MVLDPTISIQLEAKIQDSNSKSLTSVSVYHVCTKKLPEILDTQIL